MKKRIIRNRSNYDKKEDAKHEIHQVVKLIETVDESGKVVKVEKRFQKAQSKFRPGQVVDTATALRRMLNGSIVDNLVQGQYLGGDHENIDMEEFARLETHEQETILELEYEKAKDKHAKKKAEEIEKLELEAKKKEEEEIEAEFRKEFEKKKKETPPSE